MSVSLGSLGSGLVGPLPAGYGMQAIFPHQPKQPILMSDHVPLQFEKLGYSQPWIQVPTSCVYLAGKEQHDYENPCARVWTRMRPSRPHHG